MVLPLILDIWKFSRKFSFVPWPINVPLILTHRKVLIVTVDILSQDLFVASFHLYSVCAFYSLVLLCFYRLVFLRHFLPMGQ